jgi:hypothetical protein
MTLAYSTTRRNGTGYGEVGLLKLSMNQDGAKAVKTDSCLAGMAINPSFFAGREVYCLHRHSEPEYLDHLSGWKAEAKTYHECRPTLLVIFSAETRSRT